MPKTLLVTGGSSGIGRACVLYFLEKGWNVGFAYHNNIKAATEITDTYRNACFWQVDCKNSDEMKTLTDLCIKHFGRIDAVIASAGITAVNQIQDIDDAELKMLFDVNFFGTFYLFREVAKHFIHNKNGRMVAISSVNAHRGGSCETHYSASKAAVNGLVISLSQELIGSGITVNAISPGIVDTDMNMMYNKSELIKYTPLNRLCEPREVAALAYFLCSEQAGYISGQIIHQDGAVNF